MWLEIVGFYIGQSETAQNMCAWPRVKCPGGMIAVTIPRALHCLNAKCAKQNCNKQFGPPVNGLENTAEEKGALPQSAIWAIPAGNARAPIVC